MAAVCLAMGWIILTGALAPARAAELVMFERQGCVWCARWDREVAPAYAASPEGQRAPLRRVDVDRAAAPEPGLKTPVRYTPTFVLFVDGREQGRITGYMSDHFFWGLLGKMLASATSPSNLTQATDRP